MTTTQTAHGFSAGLEFGYESSSIPLIGMMIPFDFKAYVNGELVAEAEMMAAILDRN